MVQLPENMKEGHETLYDLLTLLSTADYKNLPQEEFNRLADGLQIASQQILDLSGRLMLEMDLINDLYVIHLTEAGAVMDAAEKKTLQTLLKVLWDNMQQGDTSIPEAETEDLLMQLEGKQEHYYERWLRYEIPERPDNRMKEEPENCWKRNFINSLESWKVYGRECQKQLFGLRWQECCQIFLSALTLFRSWSFISRTVWPAVRIWMKRPFPWSLSGRLW